ncbi:MAG: hypothetical protein FJY88_02065 [Candidatus Eisenbacteria bacterium]|nr:hypothetical protein [Candidatus Eisenbacteria bacterium]
MMKRIVLLVGLLCMVLAMGCPYSSKAPLADPSGKVLDDRLIGEWAVVDVDGDSMRITLLPFNEGEYYAELRENGGNPSRYRVFGFGIGSARLLHVNEISEGREPPEYSFARYTFSGNSELEVTFVGDKVVPEALATDPQALLSFLEKHLEDSALDDEETRLVMRRVE